MNSQQAARDAATELAERIWVGDGLDAYAISGPDREQVLADLHALAGALRQADRIAENLAAISACIDGSYPPDMTEETILWRRVTKVCEEAGEVRQALGGMVGENPRKGASHTRSDVIDELLDCAVAALAAVEHLTGNQRFSVFRLKVHASLMRERLQEALSGVRS